MKYLSTAAAAVLLAVVSVQAPTAQAETLTAIFEVAERITSEGKASQTRVDELTDQTRDLLDEYKTVLREVEGLRIYNAQLDRQIANQNEEMEQLNASIDQVTVIERQITPLMLEMVDGLEQFINLDVPFLLDEREARAARVGFGLGEDAGRERQREDSGQHGAQHGCRGG